MYWQASEERGVGVKEAAVVGEEANGLRVEDRVALFVDALADEEECEAWV